jgi:hypothetical protein
MRRLLAAATLVLALGATVAAISSGAGEQGWTHGVAGATAVPVRVEPPFYATPEEAALAAASRDLGKPEHLAAEVVFRFPPPNDNEVRVRVTGDRSCAMFGVVEVSPRDGWFAAGDGRDDLC